MSFPARTSHELGVILKRLRSESNLSQDELGKRVGLSQARISVIEKNPSRVSVDQLLNVMMALGATLRVESEISESKEQSLVEKW
jgi:HTH-type transcriptional regulator/antitoxin HipB